MLWALLQKAVSCKEERLIQGTENLQQQMLKNQVWLQRNAGISLLLFCPDEVVVCFQKIHILLKQTQPHICLVCIYGKETHCSKKNQGVQIMILTRKKNCISNFFVFFLFSVMKQTQIWWGAFASFIPSDSCRERLAALYWTDHRMSPVFHENSPERAFTW